MSPAEIVAQLEQCGVAVFCGDGQIMLSGALDAVPPPLLAALRRHKQDVLRWRRDSATEGARREPLSLAQERLNYLDQLIPASAAYNVAASLTLDGPVRREALLAAWRQMEGRHEALRTCLERDGEAAFASIAPDSVAYGLPPVTDLRCLPPAEARLQAAQVRSAIACASFDLGRAPLWRCALLQHAHDRLEVVFAIHHFIADGWSLANFLAETARCYRAAAAGTAALLPAPECGYASYGAWQRATLASARGREHLQWWRRFVDGFGAPAAFPLDRPRPAVLAERGGRVAFEIGADTSRRLREFAASRRSTLSELVSALHAVLLHLYSGTPRFLVGMAVSNRPSHAYRHVFGFFVNWLPVPADFHDNPGFELFFGRWCGARRDALAHQDTPFDAIARVAGAASSPAIQPLFQHMMVSHVPARKVDFGGLSAHIEPLGTGTAKMDLTLFLTDSAHAVPLSGGADAYLELEFNSALFERATIERFGADLRYLLEHVSQAPERRVADWSAALAGTAVHPALMAGPIAAPLQSPLALLQAWVRRTPDAQAVVQTAGALTYRQFWDRASAIAGLLRRHGLGAGERIALCIGRDADLLAALVAGMACRAIVVPLDPALPSRRLAAMLADSAPALLVTTSRLAPQLPEAGAGCTVLCLDEQQLAGADILQEQDCACPPDAPAYLLYTSGSTGLPKGVLGSHGALGNFLGWLNAYLACGPGDRVLAKTSCGFDASLRETLAPLCAGACVVLAGDAAHTDPEQLGALIVEQAITLLHATPSVYRAILDARAMAAPRALALRDVMCGGEQLGARLAARHFQHLPGVGLHNVYGPTECTVDVLVQRVAPEHDPVPLGRPIDGALVYLAGCDLQPAAPGAVGEIIIGGVVLGPGYWRRPTEQAQRFVTPACGPLAGQLAYRTGDLGRYNCRGELLFEGRADRQLKNSGARIELEEIEAVLLDQPGVADAAVVAHAREEGAWRLVAVVAATPAGAARMQADLPTALALRLPAYMRPARIVVLAALPLLTSGKRDWQALHALSLAPDTQDGAAEAMAPDLRIIADLMGELLGMAVDSADLDFFRAGGHSLDAARLLARMRARFGVALTLRELFADASVRGVAALVCRRRADTAVQGMPAPAPISIGAARRPRSVHE